jgi:peroxiredoxin
MSHTDEAASNDDAPGDGSSPRTSTALGSAHQRWRRWRCPLLEAIAVCTVFVVLRTLQMRSLVKGQAPAMRAVTLGGMPVALGSAAGRPQLLWFFATWCSVCRASEHNVRAMIEREGVVLVACDSGSDAELLAWLRAHSLDPRRVVNDHDGAIARAFGVRSFPATVAVSASGQVRSLDVGYTTELGLRWRLFRARN